MTLKVCWAAIVQYEKPTEPDLGDLIVRIAQSTDRIIGRQNALVDAQKDLVEKFDKALKEQKTSSRWAAVAAIAAMLTAVATFLVVCLTYVSQTPK